MIRSVLVFFSALFLGAFTVSGQEGDADQLRDQVRALTARLKARADKRSPEDAAVGRLVRRYYDVGELVYVVRDATAPQIDLHPSNFQWPEREETEPRSSFDAEQIVDLIRSVIEPETWDTVEGAEVVMLNNRIVATTIPRVHKKIAPLLKRMTREFTQALRVEIVAVPMLPKDESLLANRARELTEKETDQLLGRDVLASAVLACRSKQQVSTQMGADVTYLADFDVEIAEGATIGDAIAQRAFSGFTATVRAFLDAGGAGARLDLELARGVLDRPIRRVDTEHGPLELPVLKLTRLRTSVWVPLDRTCIVGGSWSGKEPCLYLATVRRPNVK